jgi:hypothetical protein
MNTGPRRFLLRLAVGLLAFFLGIAAAWALGGFNPLQDSSGTHYYRHKRCGSYRSWNTQPDLDSRYESAVMTELVLVSPDRSCRAKGMHGKLAPLPPEPPPPPPPGLR